MTKITAPIFSGVRGTVTELHRWPVKSMGGEPVCTLRIDHRGAAGDRTHALFDEHRGAARRLTAREAPRMLTWHATYDGADADPADPPRPRLTAPDGTPYEWDDPTLPVALAADLGREVALRRDPRGQQDLNNSLLVTTEASLRALEAELGAALDLRRFRTNVHLVLDAPAFAEETWQGRTLTVGETTLDLLHPCERCVIPTRDPDTSAKWPALLRHLAREHRTLFGINARPRGAATLRVGYAVSLAYAARPRPAASATMRATGTLSGPESTQVCPSRSHVMTRRPPSSTIVKRTPRTVVRRPSGTSSASPATIVYPTSTPLRSR
ncbi:MAG TPA: MOSC N-terminal beta barrel domain-containing protein [Solirubrobacteraceae bacterium]